MELGADLRVEEVSAGDKFGQDAEAGWVGLLQLGDEGGGVETTRRCQELFQTGGEVGTDGEQLVQARAGNSGVTGAGEPFAGWNENIRQRCQYRAFSGIESHGAGGSGFRVPGSGFGVPGSKFRVQSSKSIKVEASDQTRERVWPLTLNVARRTRNPEPQPGTRNPETRNPFHPAGTC